MFNSLGKALVVLGLVIIILGLIFIWSGKGPWLGRLPGDIYIQKKNFSFYFPLTSCIVFSMLLSLILWSLLRK